MVMFLKAMIKRISTDDKSQQDHPHFKADVVDDIDPK